MTPLSHQTSPAHLVITEAQRKVLDAVEDADVMILLTERGLAGVTWFKGIGKVPSDVQIDFGEKDDPPLTIRRVVIRAGWTLAQWRKIDRSGLHEDPS